jgi:hypothetical protein
MSRQLMECKLLKLIDVFTDKQNKLEILRLLLLWGYKPKDYADGVRLRLSLISDEHLQQLIDIATIQYNKSHTV